MRLTIDTVAALTLPAGKAELFSWDETMPGFGVRLRGTSKRWTIQYRIAGRQRRESLGDVRKVALADARKIARQRFAQVELGADPAADRNRGLTLGKIMERRIEAVPLRPRSIEAAHHIRDVHWRPFLGLAPDSIKRADVAARLQELTKERGRSAAATARRQLAAAYSWAMKQGLCETNPVIGTHNPGAGILPRDRVLNDRELAFVWRAAADLPAVRLLILTGCRAEEVGGLRWSEVDLDTGTLTIPGERIKNKRALVLALPEPALAILRAIPWREGRATVFGRSEARRSWSHVKATLDARITAANGGAPLPPWRLHDLRRTMRTGLSKLGVRPDVAELCINHVKGGVAAVYDKHKYEGEIAHALARWADHVLDVAEGRGQVVALHSA
jgi:integrase